MINCYNSMLSIDFTASVLNLFWIPPLVYSGAMILHHPKHAKGWSKWTTESDKLKLHSMLHSSICLSYALRLPTTKLQQSSQCIPLDTRFTLRVAIISLVQQRP